MSNTVRIVGGGRVGRQVADRLQYRGDDVLIIEVDEERVVALEDGEYQIHAGDGTTLEVLNAVETDRADLVVAATGDDEANLLVSQLVKTKFDVETVLARVNQSENEEPFEELGIDTISRPIATARLIDGYIESPTLTRWTEGLGRAGDLQEVPVTNDDLVGKTISEIDGELPTQCLIVVVGGEGDTHFPNREETVTAGQHLTLMGDREAVHEATDILSGELTTTATASEP